MSHPVATEPRCCNAGRDAKQGIGRESAEQSGGAPASKDDAERVSISYLLQEQEPESSQRADRRAPTKF